MIVAPAEDGMLTMLTSTLRTMTEISVVLGWMLVVESCRLLHLIGSLERLQIYSNFKLDGEINDAQNTILPITLSIAASQRAIYTSRRLSLWS